jgi:hypothetical protein
MEQSNRSGISKQGFFALLLFVTSIAGDYCEDILFEYDVDEENS